MNGEIRLGFRGTIDCEYLIGGGSFAGLLAWRPRIGEAYTVIDSSERLFRARVLELGEAKARILVYEESGKSGTSFEITLLQALPEKERMELIIQKTTELGIDKIIPFKSKKSISLEERESKQKKAHKWQDIALAASKQSRRCSIPEVLSYRPFEEALKMVKDSELKLIFWEKNNGANEPLKEVLKKNRGIKDASVIVGPEGGLEESEIDLAHRLGFIPVSLGSRILRTETASILAVGLLRYELGGR